MKNLTNNQTNSLTFVRGLNDNSESATRIRFTQLGGDTDVIIPIVSYVADCKTIVYEITLTYNVLKNGLHILYVEDESDNIYFTSTVLVDNHEGIDGYTVEDSDTIYDALGMGDEDDPVKNYASPLTLGEELISDPYLDNPSDPNWKIFAGGVVIANSEAHFIESLDYDYLATASIFEPNKSYMIKIVVHSVTGFFKVNLGNHQQYLMLEPNGGDQEVTLSYSNQDDVNHRVLMSREVGNLTEWYVKSISVKEIIEL